MQEAKDVYPALGMIANVGLVVAGACTKFITHIAGGCAKIGSKAGIQGQTGGQGHDQEPRARQRSQNKLTGDQDNVIQGRQALSGFLTLAAVH